MRSASMSLHRTRSEHPMHDQPDPRSAAGPSALPSAAEGLDHAALERLRELDPSGAARLLERVFQAFETSLARLLPTLLDAQSRGDLDGIRHVAHTLKSSSASIGALRLAQLCAEIEHMIRQGCNELPVLSPLVDQVRAESAVVLRTLAQALDRPT